MEIFSIKHVDPRPWTGSTHYLQNRHPIRPCPFLRLPPGSVRPRGWLKVQLSMQLAGLNGRLSAISDFLIYDECGWIDPEKFAWEELPYWLRGFANLAFVTGDSDALQLTEKWINGILESQQSDGWFGPNLLRHSLQGKPDLWPSMLLVNVFRSYFEYSNDARVIDFLLRYFRFIDQQPVEVFKLGWAFTRWSDNIDSAIWLYNRTQGNDWLIDLIHKINLNSASWTDDLPTMHNVNLAQGFRQPAIYSLVTEPYEPALLDLTYSIYERVMDQFGQFPGGGFAGDEKCRPGFGDPRQGFETCGMIEFIHSFAILTRLTGDRCWADRCESVALNSLPAALDPYLARSVHYITCANSTQLDNKLKTEGQFDNLFPMLSYRPGVYQYRCCAHNYGFGWPSYAEELWLATFDNGLCASAYCQCQVTAIVGNEHPAQVMIDQNTDYPFDGTVEFLIHLTQPTRFRLYLRIPEWCQQAIQLSLNDELVFDQKLSSEDCYLVVDRNWTDRDVVRLVLPMKIRTTTWLRNKNSVSLSYGPLWFSLDIDEQWNRTGGQFDWPEYEVLPKSAWNYGLVLSADESDRPLIRHRRKLNPDLNPFNKDHVPLEVQLRARRVPLWNADRQNVVGLLPLSPVETSENDQLIRLIPMGAARLRITAFPTVKV